MLMGLVMMLALSASPRIAFSPASVKVQVRTTEGVQITVVIDSEDYYTRRDFAVEEGRVTYEMWFKDLPAGHYEVIAAVSDTLGKVLKQTSLTVDIKPFGGPDE